MHTLDSLHPATAFFYFFSVLLFSVFSPHPVFGALALLGGISFCAALPGFRPTTREILTDLLLFAAVALTNPLFVHNGVTPLFFLNGNAVTKEAVLSGLHLAILLLSAVFWFRILSKIMTAEKWLFLFGKLSPKIALLLSCSLRFVPLLRQKAREIRTAQMTMGFSDGTRLRERLSASLRVYSALITWSLENAVDTGISRKARGYGLKGRTAFSFFSFSPTDFWLLLFLSVSDLLFLIAAACGRLRFSFYPKILSGQKDFLFFAAVIGFGILVFWPILTEGKEKIQWHFYRSKI